MKMVRKDGEWIFSMKCYPTVHHSTQYNSRISWSSKCAEQRPSPTSTRTKYFVVNVTGSAVQD